MASKKSVVYVGVAPCVPLGKRGQSAYTYYVSQEEKIHIGSVVKIPFGKRSIMGVVTIIGAQRPSYPTKEIKTVTAIRLTDTQMKLVQWIADACHGGFGFTARLFLPDSFAKLESADHPPTKKKKSEIPRAIIEHVASARRDMVSEIAEKSRGQVLILVPEIAMLALYEKGFAQELEDKTVMVYHAGLLQSEKKDVWQSVDAGSCKIIIGTQKALFLPFQNLVTIIVDEEHVESYKLWDQYPRLYAVIGAQKLSEYSGASVVYTSSYGSVFLRHEITEKKCKLIHDNPVIVKPHIFSFSFEDRKFKRAVPDELGSKIRTWARSGKHVLILFNKKDDSEVRKSLFFKLSAIAKKHIYIGTVGILVHPPRTQFDYVVWLHPEWTMRAIDFRSSERARITSTRLADFTKSGDVYIGSRYGDVAKEILGVEEGMWREKVLKQRKRFHMPPYSHLVRLTIRDKKEKLAKQRAEDIREMLDRKIKNKINTHVYGPYQELGAKKKVLAEYQILVSGELEQVIKLYKDLPVDSADVMPARVV
jgi:primosomal protein N'